MMSQAYTLNFAGLEVAIVENEYTSMQGLRLILENLGCQILWTARDEESARHAFNEQMPRLVFVDLRLIQGSQQPDSGWELIKQLLRLGANKRFTAVIYSSTPVNYDILLEAVRLGCSYIVKEDMWDHEEALIAGAILSALSDGVILSNEVARSLESVASGQTYNELLTEREWEVLRLLSDGLSNREIAKKQFVALSTIKSQVSSILSKLELRNRVEAAEWYRRQNY